MPTNPEGISDNEDSTNQLVSPTPSTTAADAADSAEHALQGSDWLQVEASDKPEEVWFFLRSKQEVPMSDRFAPLHCPSTGFLRRSQARTGLSKAFTSISR